MQQMKNQEPNKEVFVDGAWKLIDIKGNLVGYTALCCDILIDLETNKEFRRDEFVVFLDKKTFPVMYEKTHKCKTVRLIETDSTFEPDYLKELFVGSIMK